jgi:membrane associated rhomboid family serine protease
LNAAILAVLYAASLWAAWIAARLFCQRHRRGPFRMPIATIATLVVVGVPSLLQLTVAPGLLSTLRRTPTEVADGELWRLVTSLLVQDGGVWGATFNLVALAFIGVMAERVWGRWRWLIVWIVTGVGAQLWGLVVQPIGAGNSVGTFGLAASAAVVAIISGGALPRTAGAVSLLTGTVLLALGDIHGGAVALGAPLGAILVALSPDLLADRWRSP